MRPKQKLGEMLLSAGLLSEEQLGQALEAITYSDARLGQYLTRRGIVSEALLAELLARQLRVTRYRPADYPLDVHLAVLIPEDLARKYDAVPLKRRENVLEMGMTDPTDLEALDRLEALAQGEVVPVVCTHEEVAGLTARLYRAYAELRQAVEKVAEDGPAARLSLYLNTLNLKREPFSSSPDPDFFCLSRQHALCLQKIELSLRFRRGLSVIVGDVGTGKTTLCRHLIRKLASNDQLETHLILDPHFGSAEEFLGAFCRMFSIDLPDGGFDQPEVLRRIKDHLFGRVVNERKLVILIIDEGQKLPVFCLEILREFLNYETGEHKLLQIVILAQTEFDQLLEENREFADRVELYHLLGPLSLRETRQMIRFRLDKASDGKAGGSFFSGPAFLAVHRATGGYPRKIITLCHRIVLTMIIEKQDRARWSLVQSCIRRVFPRPSRKWRWAAAVTAAVLLLAVLWASRLDEPLEFRLPWVARESARAVPAGTQPETIGTDSSPPSTGPAAPPAPAETTPSILALPVPAPGTSGSGSGTALALAPAVPKAAKPVRLESVRGARHTDYSRIVLQFEDPVDVVGPTVKGQKAVFLLRGTDHELPPFRRYLSFDASLRLEPKGRDLEVIVDLPRKFQRLAHYTLEAPFRLVIDIH